MKHSLRDVPGWTFEIEEISANVYEITATDGFGHRVQAKGTDPDELIEGARTSARAIGNAAEGH